MSSGKEASDATLQLEVDRRIEVEKDLNSQIANRTAQLAASDDLFRMLVDSVQDYGIFMLDPQGFVISWNTGAQRINGYTLAEIAGRHFSAFYPETAVRAGKCERELEDASTLGRFEEEGWRVRKDGTQFWSAVSITAMRSSDGELIGFAKVTRDLTDRRRTDEQRRAAEERNRLLIDSVKDYAIFMLDQQGKVASWNPGAQRIKGYSAEEIIGRHFSQFYPAVDVAAGKCEMELDVASRVGRFEDEGIRVRKDGSTFWANVVISAVYGTDGKLLGFSKVTRDLTDRKRGEDEAAARLAAEKANRTKDEFLAMLGHELRNPLAPIVSAIQLLKLRGDTRSAREHQIIERQVNQMIRLVDDLLDVSRISRGKIVLRKETFDLRDALAKATEMAIPQFEHREQQFAISVPPRPLIARGDESRLVQVFANLLSNAARYTPRAGQISLSVSEVDHEIVVEVEDNGHGIDSELLPRIFDLFVQGYQTQARSHGGLGLGLTLVRAIVELHEGKVEARSKGRDQGSTFTVRLPAVADVPLASNSSGVSAVIPAPTTKRRVLVVDDNADALTLLVDMLRSLGHLVEMAATGDEALGILSTFTPDLAILDIGLPGMDGYELAQEIRRRYGNAIRLVALTGYAQPSDIERGERAGFDVHLRKPVGLAKVLEQITLSADLSAEPKP